MRAVPILGGLSRPLCYYSILCPTQQEADQFQKYFGCSTPHPSPACRDFKIQVTLIGGLSGCSILPKDLPQASGGKEAPYFSCW
ncbi:hypothetical protein PoB_002957400 [Plakobranchus ocellatus]|uniref:Uncharacterized protein n=1 Tax=Plakobranchus ocellatus TaxID=259542 RepID=A0AAV4A9B5_9GAST|nr:hypothetical protein PoB_002957400 [Plakobranchus ocellatus]